MSPSLARKMPPFTFLVVTVLFVVASDSRAQQSAGPNLNVASNEMQTRMELSNMDALGDKDEIAAFQTFSKEQTPNKRLNSETPSWRSTQRARWSSASTPV